MKTTTRIAFLALVIILSSTARCQVWPAPGAEWNYYMNYTIPSYGPYEGFLTVKPTGTMVVGGKVCTIIGGTWAQVPPSNGYPLYPMQRSQSLATYLENHVIYYYNSEGARFDTLIDYNAGIGDSWIVSGYDSACADFGISAPIKFTVTGTGQTTINSVNLKTFTLLVSPGNATVQITEQFIGTTYFFHPIYSCVIDGGDFYRGIFRCYRDNQITYFTNSACNFVSLREMKLASDKAAITPNPGSGEFKLDVTREGQLTIFNPLGQLVYSQFIEVEDQKLDLYSLQDGVYLVRFDGDPLQKLIIQKQE